MTPDNQYVHKNVDTLANKVHKNVDPLANNGHKSDSVFICGEVRPTVYICTK